MPVNGYDFGSDSFAQLLIARHYPEKTDHESALIRDFLRARLEQFDRVSFSVRIGAGRPADPSFMPEIQAASTFSSRRRIDVVLYQGKQPWLVEAKTRIDHRVLGQLLSDRQLWLEERPESVEPRLVAIGRTADEEALRVLGAHGIDVLLYDAAPTA